MIRAGKQKYNSYNTRHSMTTAYDTIKSDENINIYSNTSHATNYINNLKVGQFINFSEKENKKIIYRTGIVSGIYLDKFTLKINLGNRIIIKMITINDLVQKSIEVMK